MGEITVALTSDDVSFVRLAIKHYEVFATVSEKQGEDQTAGMMRAQEFHGQQFLKRIEEALSAQTAEEIYYRAYELGQLPGDAPSQREEP